MPLPSRIVVALAGILLLSNCARPTITPAPIDLLERLPQAERRTYGHDTEVAIRPDVVAAGGDARPAIVATARARIIYNVRLPRRASFATSVALLPASGDAVGVSLRLGLSDQRHYDQLLNLTIDPGSTGWTPVHVDLGGFSGWQWSIFYRPSRIVWDLILNVDARPGGTLAMARPMIVMR